MSRNGRLPKVDAEPHRRRDPASRFMESAKDRLLGFASRRAAPRIGGKTTEDPSDHAIALDRIDETEQVKVGESPGADPIAKPGRPRQSDEINRDIAHLCAGAIAARERPLTTYELVVILHRAGLGPTATTRQGRFRQVERALRSSLAADAGVVEIKGRFPPIEGLGRPATRAWSLR
ncbi:MAG: hypothetical protein QOH16_3516 [Gaiellaceae bacterium]|nr:hypothetical protein [Gaiellaceae bacterium]